MTIFIRRSPIQSERADSPGALPVGGGAGLRLSAQTLALLAMLVIEEQRCRGETI